MIPVKAATVASVIDDLEQQARAHGFETNRLVDADDRTQGLLVTETSFPAQRLVALARTITDPTKRNSKNLCEQKVCTSFDARLASELTRIQKSRLPSALMLVEAVPGRSSAGPRRLHKNRLEVAVSEEILSVLHAMAPANAFLEQYEENVFVCLFAGVTIGKTLAIAKEIQAEFRIRPMLKQLICTMGIAIAPAGFEIATEIFLALAEDQITQARLAVPDRIQHAVYASERLSCQVTAEERAVLFLRPKG